MSFGALDDPGIQPFLFGKMPAHGDFISRGLDDETIEAADAAVAEAVTVAALKWDYRWDDVYVETPVWRFIAAPGVLGRDWAAGVFMASVDAVGRQFPLIAGFACSSLALIARGEVLTAVLDETETLARNALLEAASVDTLLASLEGAARRFAPASLADPGEAFAAAALGRAQSAAWSAEGLFWVAGAQAVEPLALSGPLNGEALAALFQPAPVAEISAAADGQDDDTPPEPQDDLQDDPAVSSSAAPVVSSPPADAAQGHA
ncbi:MAG: type VI secretion system-associated protein TagF [Micropepsaceae bacterium]